MHYAQPIYRPPSERESLLIQVTVGCSRPVCTFCFVSQQRGVFQVRPVGDIRADIDSAAAIMGDKVYSVFLLAGDPSVTSAQLLTDIATYARARFANLQHISMYAHPRDFLHKSDQDLASIRAAGLDKVYVGIESGSATVLRNTKKGIDPEQLVVACRRAIDVGFTVSAQVVLGLGGKRHTHEHAIETGKLISRISPHYVGALSLLVYPNTELGRDVRAGTFVELELVEILHEMALMIEHVEPDQMSRPCVFRANHPSNYLEVGGTLPYDREKILRTIGQELSNPRNIKPELGRIL